MLRKRLSYLIIIGAFLIGIFFRSFMDFLNPTEIGSAETIILKESDTSVPKEDSPMSVKEDKIISVNDIRPSWGAIGWSANDKLLFFTNDIMEPLEGDQFLDTVLLEERFEDGTIYNTHKVKILIDKYNKTLVSDYYTYEPYFIDNVRYTILLSPDGEKVLVSSETIESMKIDEKQYRITNKGYSAIYNLMTGETTYIEDNSKFVKWSGDSKYVFGINYAAYYHSYMSAPYEQHFFPTHTYRNVSYNIEERKIDVVTEDIDLYESLKVSKDVYDNILNNPDLNERKRFLLGYNSNGNPYNLNYILDINKEGQYIFIGNDNLKSTGHGFPAIYIGNKRNGPKEKIFETFMSNDYKRTAISETGLLYSGKPLGNRSQNFILGLYMYDFKSGKDIMLYNGRNGHISFAYSPDSKMIAIHDEVKKDILVGRLVEDKIIDLKSYYKTKGNIFEMYFNADSSKLFFKGSPKDIDGVIYLKGE